MFFERYVEAAKTCVVGPCDRCLHLVIRMSPIGHYCRHHDRNVDLYGNPVCSNYDENYRTCGNCEHGMPERRCRKSRSQTSNREIPVMCEDWYPNQAAKYKFLLNIIRASKRHGAERRLRSTLREQIFQFVEDP